MEAGTKRMFWSEETARIYGYPVETEPTPELILQRVHPDDVDLLKSVLAQAGRQGSDFNFEHRLLMPDGSIKYILNLAHCIKDGSGKEESVGAIMDITERKAAEQKLRQQEADLRQILDFSPQIIAVFGPHYSERLFINRVALEYHGLTLEEWRDAAPGALGHPDDSKRVQAIWDRAISSGSAFESEGRLRKSDGSYRWFLIRYNPVRDEQGQVTRWYASGTDIEDRKQAEEKLHQENVALREEIDKTSMFEEIVGTSSTLQTVLSHISKVAPSDSTVLITLKDISPQMIMDPIVLGVIFLSWYLARKPAG
jgi:formate hydrogenlyase transcriptional activator